MSNEKQFNETLKIIGDLYEEGKDCLFSLSILEEEHKYYHRLFEIIQEMRDLAATNLKVNHDVE